MAAIYYKFPGHENLATYHYIRQRENMPLEIETLYNFVCQVQVYLVNYYLHIAIPILQKISSEISELRDCVKIVGRICQLLFFHFVCYYIGIYVNGVCLRAKTFSLVYSREQWNKKL